MKRKNKARGAIKYRLASLIILIGIGIFLMLSSALTLSQEKPALNQENMPVRATSESKKASASPELISQISGKFVRVPILTYHYIGENPNPEDVARDNLSVKPKDFEDQMNYLAQNGYSPITLDTLYAGLEEKISLPLKPVVLTFDDGYIDFYTNAFPILSKFNFHAVSFIPTGLINQGYYLNWAQIKEMDSSGLVIFQAHSVSHPNLSSLSDSEILFQIKESKIALESQLDKPVNFFAYPYGLGGSDYRVVKALKDVGFIGAVSTIHGNIESEGNIYNLPRIKIPGGLSLDSFSKLL